MSFLIFAYIVAIVGALSFLLFQMIRLLFKWINGEKIYSKNTYSFKWIPRSLAIAVIIATVLAIFIYWQSGSLEVTITLYIFFMACIIAGVIRTTQIEFQAKRRGAIKK
jgi:hypothetical protein